MNKKLKIIIFYFKIMLGKKIYYYFILIILVNLCQSKYIEEINNICKKVNKKHNSNYKTSNEFFKSINYDFDDSRNNYQKLQETYDYLVGTKLETDIEFSVFYLIRDYFLNRYIIPIVIIWISFCFLFFKKKLFFKHSFQFRLISKFSQNLIIIIIFFLLLILSIIIFLKVKDFSTSTNESYCNLLKFFYELNHGKIKEKELNNITNAIKNKNIENGDLWPGLYDLSSILLDSVEAINKISSNKNKTFSFLEEINDNINEYQKLIKLLIETSSQKIQNPNYSQDFDILTRYSYEFNNISRANSYINIINSEFIQYFNNATEIIKSLNNYCILLSKKKDFYDYELNNLFVNIIDFSSLMKEKSLNMTNNIFIYHEHFDIIIFIINLFSFISLVSSICAIIFTFIIMNKNLTWVRISLHIVWNIGFILIICYSCVLNFLVGYEKIIYDFLYLMDKEILKTDTNRFFNKCLNTEESDLKDVLYLLDKNSVLINIDRYYKNINPILNSLIYFEQEIPKLNNIKKISNNFNKYLNHYELSTNVTYKYSDINFVLNEITKITNNSNNNKEIQNGFFCDSNDIWVSSKTKCKDYKYISRYDLHNKFERKKGDKYCFIIQDNYQPSDLELIYGNICTKNAYVQLINYIMGLTNYYNKNENLLNSLEKIFKEIERYNKKLSNAILEQINICKNDISELTDIYNPILGDVNITYLFRCGGLKRKILNFYDINYNQSIYNCIFIKMLLSIIILLIFLGNVTIILSNKESKEIKRKYLKVENKDLNNDGVELIEEVPGEDEDT